MKNDMTGAARILAAMLAGWRTTGCSGFGARILLELTRTFRA